jgi:membrane-bound lytic murein transglycosylase B
LGTAFPQNDTRTFFDALQQRLITDGFDVGRIERIYQSKKVFFETSGVTLYFQHNEAALDYRRMINPRQLRDARA